MEKNEQVQMIQMPSAEELVEIGLNAACLAVQQAVKQPDGGLAGIMFSGREFENVFKPYCQLELSHARSRAEKERQSDNVDPSIAATCADASKVNGFMVRQCQKQDLVADVPTFMAGGYPISELPGSANGSVFCIWIGSDDIGSAEVTRAFSEFAKDHDVVGLRFVQDIPDSVHPSIAEAYADAKKVAQQQELNLVKYVIHSLSEGDATPDCKLGAFWSNEDGWGGLETATLFSTLERMDRFLPISAGSDSEWMLLEEARDQNRKLLHMEWKPSIEQRNDDGFEFLYVNGVYAGIICRVERAGQERWLSTNGREHSSKHDAKVYVETQQRQQSVGS